MNWRQNHGECPLCRRTTDLTFHHLIPKKMHRRAFFKKTYNKQQLNTGISICRTCHRGIHKAYDEMALAKRFSSLELIQQDTTLMNHFSWVSKQKVS